MKRLISILSLTLILPALATDQDGMNLCLKDLRATQQELKDFHRLDDTRIEYEKTLKDQRDDAIKQLGRAGPLLPWYVWTILGAAGATVLIRGVK